MQLPEENYSAHSRRKKIFGGLPASAAFPIILLFVTPFLIGFYSLLLSGLWVVFLKYTDSKGYSFFGFYRHKLRAYAGGYTARSKTFHNVDL